jgi:acyl dehydratase
MTAGSSASHVQREAIQLSAGKTCCSKWFQVTQSQVDAFAQATGDYQWIHSSDAGPAGSPFKGPIARGLLLLSLGINLARECGALPDATLVLCGFDNVRFRGPVRSGARVRCQTTIQDVRKVSGRLLLNTRVLMEIQDQRVPALVADCSLLSLSQVPEIAVSLPSGSLAK